MCRTLILYCLDGPIEFSGLSSITLLRLPKGAQSSAAPCDQRDLISVSKDSHPSVTQAHTPRRHQTSHQLPMMLSSTCRRTLRATGFTARQRGGLSIRLLASSGGILKGWRRGKSTDASIVDGAEYGGLAVKPDRIRNIAIVAHVGKPVVLRG